MKTRTFFFACILLLSSFFALAEKPRAKGYYVNMDGDTIKVQVVVNLFDKKKVEESGFLFGITYFEKAKEVKAGENDVLGFGFVYLGQRYDFKFVKEVIVPGVIGHMNAGGTFLRLLVRGNCELYFATSVDGRTDEYFFKRGEADNYLTKNSSSMGSHDKALAKFFEDCPALAEKIKNKEYKGDDKYLQIAKFYNTGCQTKQDEE